LATTLDASTRTNWTPIGPFAGTFNGLGNTISGLKINAPAEGDNNIGLFGVIGQGGVVQNLTLSNFTISSSATGQFIGTLAGQSAGAISNVTVTGGSVTGADNSLIGGLVGSIVPGGSVTASSASGPVTSTGANSMVGDLIGISFGLVTLSSATGDVNGTSNSYLGGLIGANAGAITESFETGKVTGSGTNNFAGGLTGANFAWGPLVTGGDPTNTGTILQSYATGPVSSGANSYVAGLAGVSLTSAPFSASISQIICHRFGERGRKQRCGQSRRRQHRCCRSDLCGRARHRRRGFGTGRTSRAEFA
jgi:hypothetical protein